MTKRWNIGVVADLPLDSNGIFTRADLEAKSRSETPLLPSRWMAPRDARFHIPNH
jgi:hypothetical protein